MKTWQMLNALLQVIAGGSFAIAAMLTIVGFVSTFVPVGWNCVTGMLAALGLLHRSPAFRLAAVARVLYAGACYSYGQSKWTAYLNRLDQDLR